MSVLSTSRKSPPRSSAAARRRRLDELGAERAAGLERALEALEHVGLGCRPAPGAARARCARPADEPSGVPPASAASAIAQSASVRAIGPGWSRLPLSGKTPRSGSAPRVGLIAEVPDSADGMRSEPAVSVPVASGIMPAASAAAEPPLDPPGVRSSAHGLPTWSVDPPAAHSCVCRWPTSTAPVAFEPCPDVAVGLGLQVDRPARRRERLAGHGVEVLQADRHAAQRRRGRARPAARRPLGRRDRVLLVEPGPRVHGIGAPVEARRAVRARSGRGGRPAPRAPTARRSCEQRGELGDAQRGGVGHCEAAASASRSANAARPWSGSQ